MSSNFGTNIPLTMLMRDSMIVSWLKPNLPYLELNMDWFANKHSVCYGGLIRDNVCIVFCSFNGPLKVYYAIFA